MLATDDIRKRKSPAIRELVLPMTDRNFVWLDPFRDAEGRVCDGPSPTLLFPKGTCPNVILFCVFGNPKISSQNDC